ncbi:VOC family protein [Micromonospora sp. WMMD1102]|uniref:VOC family protein n=1 Tax=Micromonospora sp. WMMD1102 TaxID=3016105 RepID=UPI0024158A62|nr:VOC family protein [Micromonospora sp. WMMD1102]MDG4787332.1 VOC family protein [Micromonospora sp. WMMD1102]
MTPRLDAFGLVVADMARSLAFYRRLGLEIPVEADSAPHAEHTLPGGVRLMWDTVQTVRSFDPNWSPPDGAQISLAFRCADPAEVDSVFAAMTGAGHAAHLKSWDAPWGQRYAVLLDPDGNGVDLYAPLPPAPN